MKKKILTRLGNKVEYSAAAKEVGVSRQTIYNWVERNSYKLDDYNFEIVECVQHPKGFWVCSDGEIRMKNWRKYVKAGKYKNLVRTQDGYIKVANYVYYAMTGEWEDKLLFLDGDLSNCRFDNLSKQS